ncbi:MAG: hypothetical protein ACNA8R_02690 [Nitriliruptoraceae bacterium]
MFIDADDAKTDVILAGALAVLGPTLLGLLTRLPLLPRTGVGAVLVELVALALLTLLVPLWSARYRRDGAAAFGFAEGGGGRLRVAGTTGTTAAALQLAAPVLLLGMLLAALLSSQASVIALGRVGLALRTTDPVLSLVLTLAQIAVLGVGSLVLTGFLSVRGRAGFPRSPDVSLTELVRTFGLGAVGVALLTGLVRLATGADVRVVGLNLLALVAVLLLADRLVPHGVSVPRSTVAAPLVVVVLMQTFAAGGLFGGGVLTGLHRGALAAGVVLTIASLAATRRGVAAAIPLVLAVHWWPTCLSPLPGAGGLC